MFKLQRKSGIGNLYDIVNLNVVSSFMRSWICFLILYIS